MSERTQSIIFLISSVLILAGTVLYLWNQSVASYVFAIGAVGYTVVQLVTDKKSFNFRQARLHRMNVLAGFLCLSASGLMFNGRKEWIICVTIAAIFQLYTAFVFPKAK